jgi:hypothetical protein
MTRSFKSDFSKVKEFYCKNEQKIKLLFDEASQLYNIEFDDNELSKLLDKFCGIDYILCSNNKAYGVAGRINFNKKHHQYITIRYKRSNGSKTEYQKRIEDIKNKGGEIYASITMQLDAGDDNELLNSIIFESDKLYLMIDKNKKYFEEMFMEENRFDGNLFFRIPYNYIKWLSDKYGFWVSISKDVSSPVNSSSYAGGIYRPPQKIQNKQKPKKINRKAKIKRQAKL